MCKYSLLAEGSNGAIRWCHHCGTYNIHFNNLLMNFDPIGLDDFKENINECYEHHAHCSSNKSEKSVTFNTKLDGLQFYFSVNEIAELIFLIQEAQFQELEKGFYQ